MHFPQLLTKKAKSILNFSQDWGYCQALIEMSSHSIMGFNVLAYIISQMLSEHDVEMCGNPGK